MKILNALLTVVFLWFAYLNLNDSDALLWVSIYLFAAICCGLTLFHRYFLTGYLFGFAFYLVYAIQRFLTKDGVWDWITKYNMQHIAETMQATKPWVENTREFFGLLIVAAALLLNFLVYRKKGRRQKSL